MRRTLRPSSTGAGYQKCWLDAIGVRVRPVVNAPKARLKPRFRSMLPRRPLVGGVKVFPFELMHAPAAWAPPLAEIDSPQKQKRPSDQLNEAG